MIIAERVIELISQRLDDINIKAGENCKEGEQPLTEPESNLTVCINNKKGYLLTADFSYIPKKTKLTQDEGKKINISHHHESFLLQSRDIKILLMIFCALQVQKGSLLHPQDDPLISFLMESLAYVYL